MREVHWAGRARASCSPIPPHLLCAAPPSRRWALGRAAPSGRPLWIRTAGLGLTCRCGCVCVSAHTCVRVSAHTCVRMYVCLCVCACACACVCVCARVRVCVCAPHASLVDCASHEWSELSPCGWLVEPAAWSRLSKRSTRASNLHPSPPLSVQLVNAEGQVNSNDYAARGECGLLR